MLSQQSLHITVEMRKVKGYTTIATCDGSNLSTSNLATSNLAKIMKKKQQQQKKTIRIGKFMLSFRKHSLG